MDYLKKFYFFHSFGGNTTSISSLLIVLCFLTILLKIVLKTVMMAGSELWKEKKEKKVSLLNKELEFFLNKLSKIRGNRISLDAVRGLVINYKGKKVPIKQISDLSINSQYQLVVSSDETSSLPIITKTINNSDLGLKLLKKSEKEVFFAWIR